MDAPFRHRGRQRVQPAECSVEGCTRQTEAKGLCKSHYHRLERGTPVNTPLQVKGPKGEGHLDIHGYRIIFVDGKIKREHRHVMEQMIGRKLYPFENVHHKNGLRADNRPENLELWTKPQVAGQRVEDLLKFMVSYYPEEVRQALERR